MKKLLVIAIVTVLCLAVIGGVFALYSKTPANKVITIKTSTAAGLSISGLSNLTIQPGQTVSDHITLDSDEDAEGTAILTLVFDNASTGALAQYLDITYTPADENFTATGDAVTEATFTTTGVSIILSDVPEYGILSVTCTCTDEQFAAVSGDVVDITLNFDYVDFTPVDGVWYLVGEFNGWAINEEAIALTDSVEGTTDKAKKANVTLAAGDYKAIKYDHTQASIWDMELAPGSGNFTLSDSGTKTVYVNNIWQIYMADYVAAP